MSDLLKKMAELSKSAAPYEAPHVWAHLDQYNLILWTSIPSYGRAHQLMADITTWDKAITNVGRSSIKALRDVGLPVALDDTFFSPKLQSPRDRVMDVYTRIKPGTGNWESEELQQIRDVVEADRMVTGFKEMF